MYNVITTNSEVIADISNVYTNTQWRDCGNIGVREYITKHIIFRTISSEVIVGMVDLNLI